MHIRFRSVSRFGLFVAVLVSSAGMARADCKSLLSDFDAALAKKSLVDAKKAESGIMVDLTCFSNAARVRKQRIDFELALVDDPNGPLKTDGDKEAALVDAALPVESWRASAKLADFRMVQRNFRAATAYYGEAIRRSLDMDITPVPLTDAQKSELMKRASAAKTYALDDGQGTRVVEALPTIRDVDGSIGGVYAIRGINPIPVPVPINFKYGTDQFTDTGAAMAKELADVLKEQKPKEITLVGHTDPVGTDDYNMGLSEKRVRAVARFLGAQGIALTVNIVAKGKRDPFDVSVLPIKPTRDEEYALDRRVELVR